MTFSSRSVFREPLMHSVCVIPFHRYACLKMFLPNRSVATTQKNASKTTSNASRLSATQSVINASTPLKKALTLPLVDVCHLKKKSCVPPIRHHAQKDKLSQRALAAVSVVDRISLKVKENAMTALKIQLPKLGLLTSRAASYQRGMCAQLKRRLQLVQWLLQVLLQARPFARRLVVDALASAMMSVRLSTVNKTFNSKVSK